MFDIALQILGLTVGLVYLYYEYNASHKVWIAGLIMPMVSMFVYFRKGLYADFGMNIYYLLMAVYGYLAWTGKLRFGRKAESNKEEAPLKIRHLPWQSYLWLVPAAGALWVAIALFLINATDSTVPWADAFTTALSIVGTWMLARKYLEQWITWIMVDSVCVVLYIYKDIYPYAILYAIYTAIAVLGYFKWKRMMLADLQA